MPLKRPTLDAGFSRLLRSRQTLAGLAGIINLLESISLMALAQSGTATLGGIVTDESGAFVAGAKVIVTDAGKSVRREVTTNSDGIFTLPQLAPSHYRIRIEQHGFAAT
jgi:Carboxypeptidase regulatory-like domain